MNIMQALRAVGVDVPENCHAVHLDSEHDPTWIEFDCTNTKAPPNQPVTAYRSGRQPLSEQKAALVRKAIQVQRAAWRLRDTDAAWP